MSVGGSLVVVGTGIRLISQCTPEAAHAIRSADLVYAVADCVTMDWLATLNPRTRSLHNLYGGGRSRLQTYDDMSHTILEAVRGGKRVCAVFYGHPGIYVRPSHDAISAARAEGFEARMLPGISAEDCLLADLGVDPGRDGWQGYETTSFMQRQRRFDPHTALVLWQVGVAGDVYTREFSTDSRKLGRLADVLMQSYPPDHKVTVYEAATLPITTHRADVMALAELPQARVSQISTLFVPPLQ